MAGRPRSFDEQEVLHKAMLLFWQHGYAATGILELEQATGLGRQSLYGAFGDKRALFERVVQHYFDAVIKPGIVALEEQPSPRAALEQVFAQWEQAAMLPAFNGCLMGNAVAELGLHDVDLAAVLKQKLRLMEEAFFRTLKRGQKLGELDAELDARSVARSLVTTAQGLAVVARVQRDPTFVRGVVQVLRKLIA